MAASYPAATKSFTTRSDGVDLNSAADINALQDEVTAIETDLLAAWITPTFSAGNFAAQNSTTWTVEAADVGTFAYKKIGRTMVVSFYIETTTISGTSAPGDALLITIPGGFTAAKSMVSFCAVTNSTLTDGYCWAVAGDTKIRIFKDRSQAAWVNGANGTAVYGQITFETTA